MKKFAILAVLFVALSALSALAEDVKVTAQASATAVVQIKPPAAQLPGPALTPPGGPPPETLLPEPRKLPPGPGCGVIVCPPQTCEPPCCHERRCLCLFPRLKCILGRRHGHAEGY